ncbi:hypothetical protein ACFXGI_05675 [Streptomyces sp. NPDC059355]|uniref:hypothetical protein n=1 Tax=Streptomyces sp. NPDC059355 TaxID=3346811 RepID=UPI0036CB83BE
MRRTVRANGAKAGESTLLDGVFRSADLKWTTYERSRESDVNKVGAEGPHHIADVIRKRYHQESVLTFRCLPRTSPDTDAVEIRPPVSRPPACAQRCSRTPSPASARRRLGGGSVTVDGRLVLIAPLADLPPARRLTAGPGVERNTATVRYGDEEFVAQPGVGSGRTP